MRNRYFLMKNVLAHKTSKRKCKSIPQKHNKNNGKVKEIQRASILEPQNKQREPATQISIILILTQAKQHFSIQLGVRKWHRKALRNALPISQNSYKINVNHLKWKLEPRKCYDHLCAERSPLMPDSLRISSYSRKSMQVIKNVIQRVPARLEKLLKTIGNNTNTFKTKTLSKGKLTSRGAELASGVTNQHLLMRHLCATYAPLIRKFWPGYSAQNWRTRVGTNSFAKCIGNPCNSMPKYMY